MMKAPAQKSHWLKHQCSVDRLDDQAREVDQLRRQPETSRQDYYTAGRGYVEDGSQ